MKNRTILVPVILYLGIFGVFPQEAIAAVSFDDGQIHNIDYTINDNVLVDLGMPGMKTTVNWLDGGIISHPYSLHGFADSMINVFGGFLEHDLEAYGNCQVTISGGLMYALKTSGNSHAAIYGGAMSGHLQAYDNSQVSIYGGSISGRLIATGGGQVTVLGGSIGNEIHAMTDSTITFMGSGFAIDGTSVGYGEFDTGGLHYINGMLSGTLASGELFSNDFYIFDDAKIVLAPATPAPGALLLCTIGAGLAGWLRRMGVTK